MSHTVILLHYLALKPLANRLDALTSLAQACRPEVANILKSFMALASGSP